MMKKTAHNLCSLILLFILAGELSAQTIADFDSFILGEDNYLNGSDGLGGFSDGHVYLPNQYNPNYDFWQGWAISSVTDTSTPGFLNQYSAIAGAGFEGSPNYAVSYAFDPVMINLSEEAMGGVVNGLMVTNATYAYLGIRDGDGFTKKFGGVSGDDPDFFKLTIKGFLAGAVKQDTIDFFLADFRFDDNSLDYIVNEWTQVDLTQLGNVDSLQLSLSSTDNGAFGMNTPAYFCVDHIETKDAASSVKDGLKGLDLNVHFTDKNIDLEASQAIGYQVISLDGIVLMQSSTFQEAYSIDISRLYGGIYFIVARSQFGLSETIKFFKK